MLSDDIRPCRKCAGRGMIRGIFEFMPCNACDGIGFTDPHGWWLDNYLQSRVLENRTRKVVEQPANRAEIESNRGRGPLGRHLRLD